MCLFVPKDDGIQDIIDKPMLWDSNISWYIHQRHVQLGDAYCCVIIWGTNMHTWNNALSSSRCHEWNEWDDEGERKEREDVRDLLWNWEICVWENNTSAADPRLPAEPRETALSHGCDGRGWVHFSQICISCQKNLKRYRFRWKSSHQPFSFIYQSDWMCHNSCEAQEFLGDTHFFSKMKKNVLLLFFLWSKERKGTWSHCCHNLSVWSKLLVFTLECSEDRYWICERWFSHFKRNERLEV